MKQESIKGRDIKEALIALLRGKYGKKCKYYSRQVTEGMLLPAFFVDVRLVQQRDETINVVSKQFSCRIMYFQVDPSAEGAEADQYEKIEAILSMLVCIDSHDKHAFGLVQWCFYTRKGGLLNYAKQTGKSVGNLQMQLEYLVKEMSNDYKSVWQAVTKATNIRSASDTVMLKYEKPATTTEVAKLKRANYGQKFYDQFAKKSDPQPSQTPSGTKIVRAKDQVNLRSGPGKTNARVGELKQGQTLELISTENGWHKVAVWVSGAFVRTEG